MLFNSFEFMIFFPIVFILYWLLTNNSIKAQNILLLIASYVFYGWWDWRSLVLLILISSCNFFIGLKIDIHTKDNIRKRWLIAGVLINLGVLSVFKYFSFFIDSFIDFVSLIGYDLPRSSTKIILPVGISFYIFMSLSYILDIYKWTIKANRNIIEVFLSLGFFPIIFAGPIQRPSSLLPQISKRRVFNYSMAVDGMRQILWGLFTKVVIADNLAIYVDDFFSNYSNYTGSTLLLGALFYAIQIYADFSGYSNMAIGIAKLLGFKIMRNFAYPYFARDISEFWKRWHISLVTWFRDYLFLPVSFALSARIQNDKVWFIKSDIFIYIIASTIVWLLTGLWHGANYTFIVWGLIHGFFLIIYKLQIKPKKKILKKMGINNKNKILALLETITTLIVVTFAWVFFRAESIDHAFNYISKIFSTSLFKIPLFPGRLNALISLVLIGIFFLIEWLGREQQFALQSFGLKWKRPLRLAMYYAIIITIFWFGGEEQQFIYFQF